MSSNISLFSKFKEVSFAAKTSIVINISLYFIVSIVSIFHAAKFFIEITEPSYFILAIVTSFAFEIGQVGSLFALNTLNKANKGIIWFIFIFLTFVQVIANIGYGYYNIDFVEDKYFNALNEFFSFMPSMVEHSKRIFTLIFSGSLPIVALLSMKSLINYISPPDSDLEAYEESSGNDGNDDISDLSYLDDIESNSNQDILNNEDSNPNTSSDISDIEEVTSHDLEISNSNTEDVSVSDNIQAANESVIEVEDSIKEVVGIEGVEEVGEVEKVINEHEESENKNLKKVKIINADGSHTFKNMDKKDLIIF